MRYEHSRLMKLVYDYIRAGKIDKAGEILNYCNQMWRGVTINGGLPYHDFLVSDKILLKEYYNNDFLLFSKESEDDIKITNLLDIMKTREWLMVVNKRSEELSKNDMQVSI